MSVIVCPIRGGVESKVAVARAVALARVTCLPLHFLYVVNSDLLPAAGSDDMDALIEIVRQMGLSVLGAAKAWAGSQGIRSQGVVRHGSVKDESAAVCQYLGADYLVLGRPQGPKTENVFTQALLEAFIHQIEQQAGTTVVLSGGVDR